MARLGKCGAGGCHRLEECQALSVRDLLPHMQGMHKADIIRRLENELGETAEDV